MDEPASFGYWVRRRRKALDLTQAALAARVGLSVAMIRLIEADERCPSREVAGLLAQVLDLEPAERDAFVQAARAALTVDHLPRAGVATGAHGARAVGDPRARPRTNLPVPREPLIGRDHDLARVVALLRRRKVGLVTLTGPGLEDRQDASCLAGSRRPPQRLRRWRLARLACLDCSTPSLCCRPSPRRLVSRSPAASRSPLRSSPYLDDRQLVRLSSTTSSTSWRQSAADGTAPGCAARHAAGDQPHAAASLGGA